MYERILAQVNLSVSLHIYTHLELIMGFLVECSMSYIHVHTVDDLHVV